MCLFLCDVNGVFWSLKIVGVFFEFFKVKGIIFSFEIGKFSNWGKFVEN